LRSSGDSKTTVRPSGATCVWPRTKNTTAMAAVASHRAIAAIDRTRVVIERNLLRAAISVEDRSAGPATDYRVKRARNLRSDKVC
jgi:hypothetical protein